MTMPDRVIMVRESEWREMREANALLTAEIERLRTELERRTHPISPRLLPDADGYTCDMCGRVWGIGEISGCEPCRRAVEEGGDDG